MLQCLEDEQLAQRASQCKLPQGHQNRWMCANECNRIRHFRVASARRVNHRDVGQGKHRQAHGKHGAEQIDPEHHLLTRHLVFREDLILSRVRRPIECEVDKKVRAANQACVRRQVLRRTRSLLRLFVSETHEDGDARGDHEHHEVLVRRELATVEDDVHKHHGDELARLSKDHGGVGDVGEGGKAKGRSGGDEDGAL